MTAVSNADRILATLERWPDLDDDQLSEKANIRPRQQVNQICRRLESRGLVQRLPGPHGKIINRLSGVSRDEKAPAVHSRPAASRTTTAASGLRLKVGAAELRDTLILIPCSGAKIVSPGVREVGPSLLEELPSDLAAQLTQAREARRGPARVDETSRLAAWRRNDGTLYRAARPALEWMVRSGGHLLIISGGYGVVRADEPIGLYEARLRRSHWPRGLLEQVLLAYVRRHRLRRVIAFASATTDYGRLIAAVPWAAAGVETAVLLTPEPAPGAMVKAPRAQGEALAALLTGGLDETWRSSDGIKLLVWHL